MSRRRRIAAPTPLPPAPAFFDADALFAGIHWHQRWPVFRNAYTPGVNPVLEVCDLAGLPHDLSGKRVLDVGAWNGCFSFECERRGAEEVIAFSLEHPDLSGFSRLRDLLDSKVRYVQGSIYHLSPDDLGQFDIILFLGVLYHLRYPLLALDRLRTVCRGAVHIETFTTTSKHLLAKPLTTLSRWTGLGNLFCTTPIWRQFRAREINPADRSNWFGPNVAAVLEAFSSAGFDIEHLRSYSRGQRSTFKATAQPNAPDRIITGSYEGVSSLHHDLLGLSAEAGGLFVRSE